MDLETNVRVGDFRIERRLGAGGMGIVYLARQATLDRAVALKVLGAALNLASDKARFQREAQAVARLRHPGIAEVYYVGQDRHVCYIAMEYVDGVTLREVIGRLATTRDPDQRIDTWDQFPQNGGNDDGEERFDLPTETYRHDGDAVRGDGGPGWLTPEARRLLASPGHVQRCCEVVRDAALALDHAHEHGVIHRNVKPENLMLDRRGWVHVIDFGLARFYEDMTVTNTGALVGTPMYMSPEQVTGRLILDRRTDVYSLGLVLYELLTLRRPIAAPTREAVLRQVVTKPLPPVGAANAAVPWDLEGVVHQAVAKDPDGRYPTAALLATDLGNWLTGRPVSAPRYRYRFDEREAAAVRPAYVTSVAALFFMLSITLGLVAVGLTAVAAQPVWLDPLGKALAWELSRWVWPLSFWTGTVLAGFTGWGLLGGRRWARFLAIGYCFVLPPLLSLYFHQNFVSAPEVAVAGVVLAAVFFLVMLVLLLPRTAAWFRLASRLRAEQRQPG